MKIIQLGLDAFGPFTDLGLDFSGDHGFHLIQGPNEAGKSTALRAISAWLFGIPVQTKDDFVHDKRELRVSGTLADDEGKILSFTRVKRREKTALRPDGTPLSEVELGRFLGSLTRPAFETRFRIDHDELRRGGTAMVQSKDPDEALFAAAAGIADLAKATDEVDKELESLFSPRAKNPSINSALASYEQLRRERDDAVVLPSVWAREAQLRDQLTASLEETSRSIRNNRVERDRIDRLIRARPIADTILELRSGLESYRHARLLPTGFVERRTKLQAALAAARRRLAEAIERSDRLKEEIQALVVDHVLLEQAEAVDSIRSSRARYLDDCSSRVPSLERAKLLEADADRLIAEVSMPSPPALEPSGPKRVAKAVRDEIRRLGRQYASMVREVEEKRALAAKLRAQAIEGFEPSTARELVSRLRPAIERWRPIVQVDADLAADRAELDAEYRALLDRVGRMPRWSGSLEQLREIRVPDTERIKEHRSKIDRIDKLVDEKTRDLDRSHEDRRRLAARVEEIRLGGEVPTEEELRLQRIARDRLWTGLRGLLLDEPITETPSDDDPDLSDARASIAEYELRVSRSDEVADRLRREAQRVQSLAEARAALELENDRIVQLESRLSSLRSDAAAARYEWESIWTSIGIAPGSDEEMTRWSRIRLELIEEHRKATDRRNKLKTREDRRAAVVDELRARLGELGLEGPDPRIELASCLEAICSRVERLEKSVEASEAESAADRAAALLEEWRISWADSMGKVGREGDLSPEEADAHLERLDQAHEARVAAESARREIDELERRIAAYEFRVRSVAAICGIESEGDAVDRLAADIIAAFDRASRLATERTLREKSLESIDQLARSARSEIEECEVGIAGCRVEAGLPADSDDFDVAESSSEERRRLETRLMEEERRLRDIAPAADSLDEVIAAARATDPSTLQESSDRLEGELGPLEAERDRIQRELGAVGVRLDSASGGAAAADAEQRLQLLLEAILTDAERFARLKLGRHLLDRAVHRYREKHSGTVLRRAGEIFAELTLGSFVGLDLVGEEEAGGKSDVVLRGIREVGRPVEPREMSEGTADALYLSLRLATLEVEFDQHGRIPFIIDDILVNFDDQRASAALGVLGRLAARTQILMFTHHEHLVELARSRLGPQGILKVHELPGRLAAAPAPASRRRGRG
ncbi:MAG: AAA family ATPase [Isosphaeraceae bacterium]|nr:AAA family ATPase [Isosphaeraceae bacterium]